MCLFFFFKYVLCLWWQFSKQNSNFLKDHPILIHGQSGFNHVCSLWKKNSLIYSFYCWVQCSRLSSAIVTILDFWWEQKSHNTFVVCKEASIVLPHYINSNSLSLFLNVALKLSQSNCILWLWIKSAPKSQFLMRSTKVTIGPSTFSEVWLVI